MHRLLATLLLAIGLGLAAPAADAQQKTDPGSFTRADGSGKAAAATPSAPTAPVLFSNGGGNPVTITQSASQAIVPLSGVACPTPPNTILRRFDLSQFGLGANGIDITSVSFGIETVSAAQTSTINLYRLNGAFIRANMTLVASVDVPVSPADDLSIKTVPITAAFDDTDVLVVEWAYPLAQTFFGGNAAGASGPTYVQANGCNVPEPTDLATLEFPDAHWVVNITGTTDPISGPNLLVAPAAVAFGRVAVNATSDPVPVTVQNNGTAAVTIASITGSGAPFAVDLTGTDLTLDPGESTTFAATFAPTTTGDAAGTVTITSDAQNGPHTVNLSGTGFAPPPNDDMANAAVIAAPGTFTGTNAEATDEPAETPASCQANSSASVWWSFTPATDGLLTINLSASDFDTVLTLYQPGTTEIACDDDSGDGTRSLLTNVEVTGGSPVLIRVTGFGGATGAISGDLAFVEGALVSTPIPAGNTTGGPTWNRPQTVGTGTSGSCALSGTGTAVPYETRTFTVAEANLYTITTAYTDHDGYLLLYEGSFNSADPCLNLIGLSDDFGGTGGSQIAGAALDPGTYVLVVTGFGNADFGPYTGEVEGPAAVTFTTTAGEAGPGAAADALSAAPNPTTGRADVRLAVAEAQHVVVAVFDVTGRRVATLHDGMVAAGQALTLALDASALPAGVYVVRAAGEHFQGTQRLTVAR